MPALRTLLDSLIDYAGLFPPAGLDLPTASANYAAYRAGDEAWALGRFVLPAARLRELETSADAQLQAGGEPWRITALAGPDLGRDLAEIAGFNERQRGHAVADTIELKSATTAAISDTLATINGALDAFVEIPIADDPGGNAICLGMSGNERGKVYFWDHEMEADEGDEPTFENVYLVAESFASFLKSLKDLPKE